MYFMVSLSKYFHLKRKKLCLTTEGTMYELHDWLANQTDNINKSAVCIYVQLWTNLKL